MKHSNEAIAVADSLAAIKEHWLWITQNVLPEILQMEADTQIVDYLLLKFECLAIEEEVQAEKDVDAEKDKRSALFVQNFGLLDERLLEGMIRGGNYRVCDCERVSDHLFSLCLFFA